MKEATRVSLSAVFSPNRYWLCAATSSSITIFGLEKWSKVNELKPLKSVDVAHDIGGMEVELCKVMNT
jgi:hypothetical protein